MTSLLEARGLEIAGRLAPSDLSVAAGALVALIGPNGGGKTSLLRACAGIEGTGQALTVGGEDLRHAPPSRRSRLLGYLPASRELVWPIQARDVIALGLPAPDIARVDQLVALLELEALAAKPADRLSTGERARVLLARALAPRPRVLLLDEPLSNLDPYWVLRMLELMRSEADAGTAVIVALHDIDRMAAFDRVVLVEGGKIVANEPPASMVASQELRKAFRIHRASGSWQISPSAGLQSSP